MSDGEHGQVRRYLLHQKKEMTLFVARLSTETNRLKDLNQGSRDRCNTIFGVCRNGSLLSKKGCDGADAEMNLIHPDQRANTRECQRAVVDESDRVAASGLHDKQTVDSSLVHLESLTSLKGPIGPKPVE